MIVLIAHTDGQSGKTCTKSTFARKQIPDALTYIREAKMINSWVYHTGKVS